MGQLVELTTATGTIHVDPEHVYAVGIVGAVVTVYFLGLSVVVTDAGSDVIAAINFGKLEGPTRTHQIHVSGPGR